MKMTPVSFGRVIKVNNVNKFQNANDYLAGIIAPKQQEMRKWIGIVRATEAKPEHKEIESQLQTLFPDASTAPVRTFMFENDKYTKDNDEEMFDHYIVTGEDSKKIGEILSPVADRWKLLGGGRGADYECDSLMYELGPKVKDYINRHKDKTEININSSLTARNDYKITDFEIVG